MTDHELLDRTRRGETQALAWLYDRHAGKLMAIGRRLLRDERAAEDVVHDVFLAAWRDAARFDPSRGSVRTWLCVRMRSRCLDRLRKRAVRDNARDHVPVPQSLPAPDALLLDTARLLPLLDQLPEPQRDAVRLRYLEGMTSADAAEALGCPTGTVKSRLRAGLSQLRALLDVEEVA